MSWIAMFCLVNAHFITNILYLYFYQVCNCMFHVVFASFMMHGLLICRCLPACYVSFIKHVKLCMLFYIPYSPNSLQWRQCVAQCSQSIIAHVTILRYTNLGWRAQILRQSLNCALTSLHWVGWIWYSDNLSKCSHSLIQRPVIIPSISNVHSLGASLCMDFTSC